MARAAAATGAVAVVWPRYLCRRAGFRQQGNRSLTGFIFLGGGETPWLGREEEPSGPADGRPTMVYYFHVRVGVWLAGGTTRFFAWHLSHLPLHSFFREATAVPVTQRVVRPTKCYTGALVSKTIK